MFELHDYRIYYVNIDLHHQYGISVAESQMFLCAKRPQRRRARRNGRFCRLQHLKLNQKAMLIMVIELSGVQFGLKSYA